MEFVDIVNERDEVIGKASRKEIYEKLLSHRIVHVLVFDKKGRMALQLRSKKIDFCPNCWSTAVGGHVMSGESYEQAAIRESKEELGIIPKLDFFSKDIYIDPRNFIKHLTIYKAIYTGKFNEDSNDVEKTEFFTIHKIQKMIDNGKRFHPELIFILKKHFGIKA